MENMIEFNPVFKVGQLLYYALKESEAGLLTDVTYRLSSNIIWYHVTFDPNIGEIACRDFELSESKLF